MSRFACMRMGKQLDNLYPYLFLPVRFATFAFDFLEARWASPRTRRWVANALVFVFIAALIFIEANRWDILPEPVGSVLPKNHFYAVRLAFDLLLLIEVFGLIFGLAGSVANAMGKQFEILSLILLRQSFKEFVYFDEPIKWEQISGSVLHILSDAGGALVVFVLVLFYYRLQKHRRITNTKDFAIFLDIKKTIAIVLLLLFFGIGINYWWQWAKTGELYPFFEIFYTVLIFSDILIVLVSLRYSKIFGIVFRNSGFAVSTVLIRLALSAPPFINVLLGIAAVSLGIGLTLAYNFFATLPETETAGVAKA